MSSFQLLGHSYGTTVKSLHPTLSQDRKVQFPWTHLGFRADQVCSFMPQKSYWGQVFA